jgi:hypothetical protein
MTNPLDVLSDVQARLFNKLDGAGDVTIVELFRVLKHRRPTAHESKRVQQQAIGTDIARANRKLLVFGLKIAPGVARGTYRLLKL